MAPTINSGPGEMDWIVYAGDRNKETFEIVSATDPVDITGAVVEAQARTTAKEPTVALTAAVDLTDPTLGRFTVQWDGDAVRTLLAGSDSWEGVWDLQIIESGETLAAGQTDANGPAVGGNPRSTCGDC